MLTVSVLGSTGSIGVNTLDICGRFPELFKITALAAGRNMELLARQIRLFKPLLAAVYGPEEQKRLAGLLTGGELKGLEILWGPKGYLEAARQPEARLVVSALVGAAGLEPTWEAVRYGKTLALANKEALALGGELIMPRARRNQTLVLPIDSEHSAIFQALAGRKDDAQVRRLILTASGGPFLGLTKKQLASVSAEQALNHPRWRMGPKVSCDSATLMNKGLEVIEAHHLFQIPYERISAVVHPQSVIHSLVEFIDGSQLAQLGLTDMRLPIAYALGYPKRLPLQPGDGDAPGWPFLDLTRSEPLTFEELDQDTFPAFRIARQAGLAGGTAPTILNAANEEAVTAFLSKQIPFPAISQILEETLSLVAAGPLGGLEDILAADRLAREEALKFIKARFGN